jgi:tape measure domain-containing protein
VPQVIGEAAVRIRPETSGFQSQTRTSVLGTLTRVGAAVGLVSAGFKAFQFAKTAMIGFNAQLQQSRAAFTVLLGGVKPANAALASLQKFARQTPFEFQDLLPVAQQLLGTGTKLGDLVPTMNLLGDSISAVGGGAPQLRQLTLAYTQLATSGTAHLGDLMQINNAVPGALTRIAQAAGMSVGQFRAAVSLGKITSAEAVRFMNQGFQGFKGSMEAQSKTFTGSLSNISDALTQNIARAGAPVFGLLNRLAFRFATFLGQKNAFTVPVIFSGLKSLASDLLGTIHDALLGTGATIKPIRLPTGKFLEFQKVSGQQGLAGQIADSLRGVNWSSVGTTIGQGISKTIKLTGAAATGMVSSLIGAINSNRGAIAGAGVLIVATMFLKLTDPAFWLENWRVAADLAVAAIGLAFVPERFIAPLARIPILGTLLRGLRGAGKKVLPYIEDFMRGILRGIEKEIPGVTRGAGRIVSGIIGEIRVLPTRALVFVSRMASGIGELLGRLVGRGASLAGSFVRSILSRLLGLVGDALSAMGRVAANIIRPLLNLAGKGASAIRSLGSRVLSAIGSAFSGAGTWLYDIGIRIIEGLISGITSKLGGLKDTLGGIASKVTSWKGPPEKDAKLLRPIGGLIMGGLIGGIADMRGQLRAQLQSVTADIASGVGAPGAAVQVAGGSGSLHIGHIGHMTVVTPDAGRFGDDLSARARRVQRAT